MQKNNPPTNPELDHFAAEEIMGWEVKTHSDGFQTRNDYHESWGLKTFAISVADFSPTTKIEQALECLIAWNKECLHVDMIDLIFDAFKGTWRVGLAKDEFNVNPIELKDLALKIMQTLWEMEEGSNA